MGGLAYQNDGPFTMTSGEALEADRLVLLSNSTLMYSDGGEEPIGITQEAVAISTPVACEPLNGTIKKVTGSKAIAADTAIYATTDGKVSDAAVGKKIGILLTAITGDGGKGAAIVWGVQGGSDVRDADQAAVIGGVGGIAALDMVYVSDQTAGVMTVLKAQSTSGGRFADYLCPSAIAAAASGIALKVYLLQGIDTSAGSVGDPVYLSDGTAGGYTLTKPTATDKVQIVGRIVEDHATTGAILFDLSGPQQVVHTHADNSEGGEVDIGGVGSYARGSIIAGGASDWEALDGKGDGNIIVGDGTDVNSVAVSGDVTLANTGAVTIAADAVSNAKLANITRGSVKVGGASDAPTDLDAKTNGYILVGDGTDVNSVAVSGDITLANTGAVTIANDAVDNNMLANIARGSVKVGGASDAPTDLDAKTNGYILVGDGTDVNSVAVSGDATLANTGAVTIAQVLEGSNAANIADGGHSLPFIIQKTFPDQATNDVEIYNANAPFKFRVIDVWVENRAANGANANTLQVCAAAAGSNPITDAMSLNAVADNGIVRAAEVYDTDGTVAANGSMYLRQTKVGGTMGGNVYILAVRVA